MLEKSKVVSLLQPEVVVSDRSPPSAWKLRVASVDAILDYLIFLESSGAKGNPVPDVLKYFLLACAVLKYLSLESELAFLRGFLTT